MKYCSLRSIMDTHDIKHYRIHATKLFTRSSETIGGGPIPFCFTVWPTRRG